MASTSQIGGSTQPALTSPGIGSGLDINSIITQLMQIESRPLQALQKQQSSTESSVSALGSLKSALSTFQSAMDGMTQDKLQAHTATSADTAIFDATATGAAAPGTYQIEVVSLAQAQRMLSGAQPDADTTTIGNAGDQMTIQVGSDPANAFTVTVGGQTLQEIRDGINSASDNKGVTASILHTDAGYQLVLSSNQTGTDNALTLSFTDSTNAAISDPLSMTTSQAASDAVIKVDGQQATRSTNSISDVLEGVTLNLAGQSATGVTTALTVATDSSAIHDAVQSFADAYNALHKSVAGLGSGALSGDGTVGLISTMLLNVLNTPASGVSSTYSYLAEIGLSIQKDGTMALDTTQLDTALNTDPSGVAQLFMNSSQGFAPRFSDLARQLTASGGMVDTEVQGLNDTLSRLQDRISSEQANLADIETNLRAQYSALDSLLGTMTSTSNFLGKQLASLPQGG